MGMIGQYVAMPNELIVKLAEGSLLLNDVDLQKYEGLDIDKSWEGIHFWLTEELNDGEPPQGYVVPLRDEQYLDFGSFGAFYLFVDQVKEAAVYLERVTEDELKERYDFQTMVDEQIYPLVEGDEQQEFYDYMKVNLDEIGRFYAKSVAEGKGIVFYIF